MPGPAGFFWKYQTKAGVATWLLTVSHVWNLEVPGPSSALP